MPHVVEKNPEKSSKMNQHLHFPIPNTFEEDQHSNSNTRHSSVDLLSRSFSHKFIYSFCYKQRNYKSKERITQKENFQIKNIRNKSIIMKYSYGDL